MGLPNDESGTARRIRIIEVKSRSLHSYLDACHTIGAMHQRRPVPAIPERSNGVAPLPHARCLREPGGLSAAMTPSSQYAGLRLWAVPCAGMAGAVAIALSGFAKDPYLQAVRGITLPHDYPSAMVAGLIAFAIVTSLLMQAILRPGSYRKSWGRALTALMMVLVLLYMTAMAAIHAPPPLVVCLYWLLGIAASIAGLLLWSTVQAFRGRPVEEGRHGPRNTLE